MNGLRIMVADDWMKTHHHEYELLEDMVSDCCVIFSLWGNDFEIPLWLDAIAEKYLNAKKSKI